MKNKIIPVAKHFPGLGEVKEDPHLTFPKLKRLSVTSLMPFIKLIDYRIPAIMTTHLITERHYGNEIATKNPKIIKMLRTGYGFDGIIMTDDLALMSTGLINKDKERGATKENIENIVNTAYGAIKAGHDMIICRQLGYINNENTNYIKMIIDKLEEGVKTGDIPKDQIEYSNRKIQRLLKESF